MVGVLVETLESNSDLLIAIGSRISGRVTGGNIHSFARNEEICC